MKPLREAREEWENDYVRQAMELAGGKISRAVQLLGITRKHLWYLRKRAEIKIKRKR